MVEAADLVARIIVLCVAFVLLFYLFVDVERESHDVDPDNLFTWTDEELETSNLPRIIHVFWDGPISDINKHEKITRSNIPYNVEYRVWNFTEVKTLCKTKFKWFYPTFLSLSSGGGGDYVLFQSDMARIMVLYEFGGVYMDLDYEVLDDSFWDRLPDDHPSVVESVYKRNENVQNSLMTSPRRHHPFWISYLMEIAHLVKEKKHQTSSAVYTTGPMSLDRAIQTFPNIIWKLKCASWNPQFTEKQFVLGTGKDKCKFQTSTVHYGKHHGNSLNWLFN